MMGYPLQPQTYGMEGCNLPGNYQTKLDKQEKTYVENMSHIL